MVTTPVTVPAAGYAQPARVLRKGDVVELSASEVTTIGAGNLRAVTLMAATARHDQLGEAVGVSNGD